MQCWRRRRTKRDEFWLATTHTQRFEPWVALESQQRGSLPLLPALEPFPIENLGVVREGGDCRWGQVWPNSGEERKKRRRKGREQRRVGRTVAETVKVVVCGRCLVTLSLTINETLKWLSSLPTLIHKSFWWWQCSDRYTISPPPPHHHPHPTSIPPSPFSPSLINLTVSVNVEHRVYCCRSNTDRHSYGRRYQRSSSNCGCGLCSCRTQCEKVSSQGQKYSARGFQVLSSVPLYLFVFCFCLFVCFVLFFDSTFKYNTILTFSSNKNPS